MRSRKAFMNMSTSLLLQLVSTVCGIFLPRLFITQYGSAVNGTIASVTQFLSYIVLFEAGVGGVVRAALYKPLSENNSQKISSVLKSTDNFFRKTAFIFLVYTTIISVVFPLFIDNSFDFLFTFSLVLIIAFSTFLQYYFGLSCQILLHADQKRYIYSVIQICAVTLNAVCVALMIHFGASIHSVKLITALIYGIRPIILRLYVRRHYSPDPKALPDRDALKDKWNGFGHHTAYFLHSNTDIAVLTLAAPLTEHLNIASISVYTVYYTIAAGIKNLINAVSSGLEGAFGNIIAKGETDALKKNFRIYEFVSFVMTTVMFTCVGLLIVPFVRIYTKGVTDVNYIEPVFALLITLSEAVYCLRIPYNNVTLAAGHYKQTRNGAFAEAAINIALSVALVVPFGLSGVASATLVAMVFRTIQYAVYLSKNIVHIRVSSFFLRCLVNALCSCVSVFIVKALHLLPETLSYFTWFVYALIVFAVTSAVTIIVNTAVYGKDFKNLLLTVKNIFERKKS